MRHLRQRAAVRHSACCQLGPPGRSASVAPIARLPTRPRLRPYYGGYFRRGNLSDDQLRRVLRPSLVLAAVYQAGEARQEAASVRLAVVKLPAPQQVLRT